jgi:hypothetical protein
MTKTDILDLAARQSTVSRATLKFSRLTLADADIEKQAAPARIVTQWFNRGVNVSHWALPVFALCVAVLTFESTKSGNPVGDWLMAATTGCLIAGGVALSMLLVTLPMLIVERTAKLLTPIAGTELCEMGVKLLRQGGPLPAAWRDIALNERGQLYRFDLEIMRALARGHQAETEKAECQSKRDTACRELHGLAPAP